MHSMWLAWMVVLQLFESVKYGFNDSMHESADTASECDMVVSSIS